MLIRRATTSDIADVARVHVSSWDAAKDGLELTTRRSVQDREEFWSGFLAEGRGELRLTEVDGQVVGFIAFGTSRDDDRAGESEIYTLYVDPGVWGRGIGSALMSQVPLDQVVSLWVGEGNDRARGFYARHGFAPDGAREEGHHVPVTRVVRAAADVRPKD